MSVRRFMADLFKGVGNQHWDLGRILAFVSALAMTGAAIWNMSTGHPIDLMALGGGFAAVLTAGAAMIGVKDFANPANRKPNVTVEGDIQSASVAGDLNVQGEVK